mmetsp:Transcript_37310/g.42627  ORF Transcript_37310/g.42627 Transcript_37310/m.42627 type:complete len:811 (+) Transcript_37310:138-2570(+)
MNQSQILTAEQLKLVLEQTLSPRPETRREAEGHLTAARGTDGHAVNVLKLVASLGELDAAVRQAGIVHFKNLVKKGWDTEDEDADESIVISENDRTLIKDHLVELMSTVPRKIQSQCSEAISQIAKCDFPAKWENLLPMLVQKFSSPDRSVVNGVLLTAQSIFSRFCFVRRSDDLYRDIIYSLKHVQAPLLHLIKATSIEIDTFQANCQELKVRFESLRLISCIFFSLNYQDLPEFFEDHMNEWMAEFTKYLKYTNPLLIDTDEETEPSPIDKVQAAIVQNLFLYADKDEEPFLPFLPEFTRLVWVLLMGTTTLSKHDNLATKCINFLSSLIKKLMHKHLFQEEATLRQIIGSIVIPNLTLREVDQELFEDDPTEFIAIDIEGNESGSRRNCSQQLLRAMCNQFDQATCTICFEHIIRMLEEFQNNPDQNWTAKDAAINVMIGIISKFETTTKGVSQVKDLPRLLDFFSKHILPELRDNNHIVRPMLKSTSIKFVCFFRNQFSKEQLIELIPFLILHLSSPFVAVHTYAAVAIEKIFSMKIEKKPKFLSTDIRPFLEALFTPLFEIIKNQKLNENEYVMKCVMRSLSVADEDIIPATQAVIEQLTMTLGWVAKNPRNPHFNHYLFESLASLVQSVCRKQPEAVSSFETFLFPPFQLILQQDVSEFTPYVFQVFAQLLEFRQKGTGLGDAYSSLLIACVTPAAWERKGNIPALTRLLRAYLQQAPVEVLKLDCFMKIMGVWQKLISSKSNERSAFELLTSIICSIPENVPHREIFRIILTRLGKSTDRFKRLTSTFFCCFYWQIWGTNVFR